LLKIKEDHIEKFRKIKKEFLPKAKFPKENNWKKRTNNDIWLSIIDQVIVVGGTKPVEKFWENEEMLDKVSYEKLIKIDDKKELKKIIHKALREAGTRYVGDKIAKDRKASAFSI